MSLTSYNAEFGHKQESLVRNGDYVAKARRAKMTKEEYDRFLSSPAMQRQAHYEDVCNVKTSARDKRRMQSDKTFKPKDSDWTAKKAFDFDPRIDYYRVLGVDEYEPLEGIKKAYRRLSLVYHPDKTAGMPEDQAAEHQKIFIEVNNAYLVLGDHPTRRQYDKKRDDNVVAEELWGQVTKKKEMSQFDAFQVLAEMAAKKPKPAETIAVPVPVKLEKMFYGGSKLVEKAVQRETFEGFETEELMFEVIVPPVCNEGHGVVRKGIGDHHKERKPDNIRFLLQGKKHARVERQADDIVLKSAVKLRAGALKDPYTSGEALGLGGRVVMFFGRNPFYSVHRHGACTLKVAVLGEAFGKKGKLCFDVEFPSEPLPHEQETQDEPVLQDALEARAQRRPLDPRLQARRLRAQGERLSCQAELSPLRGPLELGTKPSSCLRFYGNLQQSSAVAGAGFVRPRAMFAIVLSCPVGASRSHRSDWQKLCKSMLPLVWLNFWMLVPPMRSLQPRLLDTLPAYCDECANRDAGGQAQKVPESRNGATESAPAGFFDSAGDVDDSLRPPIEVFLLRFRLGPPGGIPPPEEDEPAPAVKPQKDGTEEVDIRPAWANPEPVGLPVVMGPQQSTAKVVATTQTSRRYRSWSLYPYVITRPPPRERHKDDTTAVDPCAPWIPLGDRAFGYGDCWVAYRHYTQAALEAGFVDRIRGLDDESSSAGLIREAEESSEVCQERVELEQGDSAASCSSSPHDKKAAGLALARRADCLQHVQQIHAALLDARSASQLLPKWSQAWRRVGVLEARLGRPSAAWEALFRAVELDPHDQLNLDVLQRLKCQHAGEPSVIARAEKIVGTGVFKESPSKAIAHYTVALGAMSVPCEGLDNLDDPETCPEEDSRLLAEIFSNRSAAFAKLGIWAAAVRDAENALALPGRSDWMKGHVRLGTALLGACRFEDAYSHFAKAAAITEDPKDPARLGREACLIMAGCWQSSLAKAHKARFWKDAGRPQKLTRIFAVSDIHFDHPKAEDWVHRISRAKFKEDVLIVAGDVAENINKVRICLTHLRAKFRRVFFIPGNHDLWIHTIEEKEIPDSIDKLFRYVSLCDELDVDIFPAAVCRDVFVVPMFSWYNAEFDEEDPFASSRYMFDKYCKWPMNKDNEVWRYMMYLNHGFLQMPREGINITFSHFLSRRSLPFSRHVPGLVKAVGCTQLDAQIREAQSSCHVFGHSHKHFSREEDGVRYVQSPLGYKDEHGPDDPLCCVFDGGKGGLVCEKRHLFRFD